MVTVADESNAEYFNVEPVDGYIVKVGGSIEYEAPFYHQDYTIMKIDYDAYLLNSNGDKISGKVSPSTGTYLSNGVKTLKVTAPEDAGIYRLVVEYEGTIDEDTYSGSSEAFVRVVVPITLTADVTNTGDVTGSITISFMLKKDSAEEFEAIEGSETTVNNLEPGDTKTVTYEWVTESLGNGKYTYKAVMADNSLLSEGEFYIGHNEYQWATIVMAILFIILIIALIYVVRKPVKNYGKPKGRR